MNPFERLAIWEGHLAANQAILSNFPNMFSGAPESMRARVLANLEDSIRNCQKNITHWQEKALTN